MPRDIPKAYEPRQIEERWAKRWAEENLFRADVNAPGPVFSIVIPPPNVTGSLHIGHMLDHTEIDILTRWRRMSGYNTLYLPGTDHAGISTQRVVVRQLAAKGINYRDLGREAFERKVWEWKEESGGTITRQMLQLGESCDWTRERFTLSPELSRAVTEVFVRLYEDGLIYRGHYIVPAMPHGDQRPRNGSRRASRAPLAYSLPDCRHERIRGCGDHAARNHAGRYWRRRPSERSPLPASARKNGSAAVDESRNSHRG